MPAATGPHEPGGRSDDSDPVRARSYGAPRLRTRGAVAWVQVAKGNALRERLRLTPANRSRQWFLTGR